LHDIRMIRADPAEFDRQMARRGLDPVASEILSLDEYVRHHKARAQELLADRNRITKEIGMGMVHSAWTEIAKAKVRELNEKIKREEEHIAIYEGDLNQLLCELPNILDKFVPVDNQATLYEPTIPLFEPKDHATLGAKIGFEPETGAALAGSRFPFLRGDMARLHRAVGQFMLDTHISVGGFIECIPPVIVNEDAMFGTDKLPKFSEDSFKVPGGWLIPTGEVPLVASVADRILNGEELPIRMVALTQCFRSEVGSLGRDATGLLRQHQFEKVELVSITRPEDSAAEHDFLRGSAISILDKLELPYRLVLLSEEETGFGAAITYDLEVWFPGMKRWVEVASCSNCGDFQARRMNTRYKEHHKDKAKFVYTLNASGLAVGRTVAAIIENYQHDDGCITIPPPLRRYFDDARIIIPN